MRVAAAVAVLRQLSGGRERRWRRELLLQVKRLPHEARHHKAEGGSLCRLVGTIREQRIDMKASISGLLWLDGLLEFLRRVFSFVLPSGGISLAATVHSLAAVPSLRALSPVLSLTEVFIIRRVDCPEVALPVGAPANLNEALVEAQVMPDAVPPAWTLVAEVRVVCEDEIVDVAQNKLLLRRAQDRLADQTDVGLTWFLSVVLVIHPLPPARVVGQELVPQERLSLFRPLVSRYERTDVRGEITAQAERMRDVRSHRAVHRSSVSHWEVGRSFTRLGGVEGREGGRQIHGVARWLLLSCSANAKFDCWGLAGVVKCLAWYRQSEWHVFT